MDHSGNNSGSMQSSSDGGDDQDYDSRNNDTISPLFNSSFCSTFSNHHPPPPQPSTLFDSQLHSQPHNLHPFSNSPPTNINQLDLVWSRSDQPNYSSLGNLTPLSSTQSQFLSLHGNTTTPPTRVAPNPVSNHQNQTNNVQAGKSASRKRTRASRRAPTTVLTTDPSNFRQMVQEFTGIPAPPFSAFSSPYARRLDLFSGGSPLMRSGGHLDALGPIYPFRPSAQKVLHNPLVSSTNSSSLSPSVLLNNTTPIGSTSNNNSNDANAFSSNYQMNMENPILTSTTTFQSLLQSNGPHFGTKSQGSLGIPCMDHDLGMGQQQHVDGTNLSEFAMQVGGSTNNILTRSTWRGEEGANDDQDQHLGSFNGNNGGPQNGSAGIYKMNGSGSLLDFCSEKRMENVSSRNESTVDSWICPSD